tara:strand:- start:5663 stop:7954 length:2292 start_codon:yes stop_codon:yes gene_type:complete
MSNINVTKRNGELVPLDIEKIHKCIEWAGKGLKDVSISQVALSAQIQFYDGIPTSDIHDIIIKAAADLITAEAPDYAIMAARLNIIQIRKMAFGQFTPPALGDHVNKLIAAGKYDKEITQDYSDKELAELDHYIDHSRDLNFAYAAVKQLEGKYLVQNRVTGDIYESPQFAYMLIGACLFSKYEKDVRLDYVKRFYDAVSQFRISLPTPIMSGVRTPTRQFSSCVLIDCDDSLDSINATASSIVKYVSQRAGIGVNAGRLRALGSEIRGGEAFHTGVIPFYKYFQTAVKSCSQGGVRGGAATLFYPAWHLEVESLLVLKNNRGVEENRVRHLDYGVQFNKLMYQRMIKDGVITLFSPSDVPDMYDAFFADQEKFEELYVKYENDDSIRKKQIKAMELFSLFMQERASTGRIYLQNVDHCNTHSPFDPIVAPIKQSNLCLEIALPTKPLDHVQDDEGEIALCTLAAFNSSAYVGSNGLVNVVLLEEDAELIVRALDSLLDYQDYPVPAARKSSLNRRTLGVGVVDLAHTIAKNGMKYSDGSANALMHRFFEAMQFNLMKASVDLAKDKGACPLFHETVLSKGVLPIDTYRKEIDKVTDQELLCDWEALRTDILKYGMRNSTVSALMPSETSSQVLNATNGIEPPRGLVSIKSSKDGVLKQVVPNVAELADQYELLWDMGTNDGYLQICGIAQKFICQAISANTNYDPSKFEGNKVPMKLLLKDMLTIYKLGIKTAYYHNTRDGAGESGEIEKEDESCQGGACKI